MNQTYNDRINEVLEEVKKGQHLRFVNKNYRTKEVCLAAVNYESGHNTTMLNDIYSVPMGNLDYVMAHMRVIKKDDSFYLGELEQAYIRKKALEHAPGFYGDFKDYQSMLDHYGAVDYDDMIRKHFNQEYTKGISKSS